MKKVLLFLCAMMVAQLAQAWYVVGSFCGWDVNQAVEMTKQADGTYLLADYTLETGVEFKFIETRGWGSNLGPGTNVQPNTEYKLYANGGNAVWQGETGACDIVLDATAKKMKVVSDAGVVEATKYYVYFDNSASNWDEVYVYTWGSVSFGEWPGTKLTEKTPEGYYIAVCEAMSDPAGAGLLFNVGGDANKTGDLEWRTNAIYNKDGDTGKTYDGGVVEPEKESLVYNVTVPAGTPACFIAGEMNGWSFTEMTKVDETHYTITIEEVTKAMKYKYCASASWDNVEMQADGETDVQNRTWSENDVVATWKGITTTDPDTPEETGVTYNVTVPAGTPACYISGGMNDWTFTEMTMVDETHYTITIAEATKAMKYKYSASASWDNVEMQADGVTDVQDRTWSENDVVAAWKGLADVETETLTYNVEVPVGTPACYIAGDMNSWAFTAMTKVDDTHYTITFDNVHKAMGYKYACGDSWEYEEVTAEGGNVGNRTWSENDVVAAWEATPSTEPETPETLTYDVTVPAGTPACYISGGMNDWTFTEMTKVDDTHYTITFNDVTKSTEYKYFNGPDYAYAECYADLNYRANRTWAESDVVEAWESTWSSVESVEAAGVKVYGANGVLCVRAAEEVALNVYNAQGMLVKALVVEGAADINLAAGMYIVNGTKVLVY